MPPKRHAPAGARPESTAESRPKGLGGGTTGRWRVSSPRSDLEIWSRAATGGFVLMAKDDAFRQLSCRGGHVSVASDLPTSLELLAPKSRASRLEIMFNERPSLVAPWCLIIGALLGLAGSFAPSASLRGLAWGVDGTALIVGAAVLAVHFIRHGHEVLAAGFLVFIAGEALVVSGSAMSLEASGPSFAAGAALWAAALVLISAPKAMPLPVRALGFVAALLFAGTALQIFAGRSLTPLSEPLPFFAYPFLVFTMFGWAWWCLRAPPHT